MADSIVSIIVPVYNSDVYISECIESVLSQSYKNWELILVDDGSTDQSASICKSYSNKDSRIRTLSKTNGGVSSARNLALSCMKGEWVCFLDSDDMLYADALENLIHLSKVSNLDVLQFAFTRKFENRCSSSFETEVLDSAKYIENKCYNVCAAGSFIKSEIILKNKIKFNEKVQLGEDQLFVFDVFKYSRRIKYVSDIYYYYRINETSAVYNPKIDNLINSINAFVEYKTINPISRRHFDDMTFKFIYDLVINPKVSPENIRSLYRSAQITSVSKFYSRGHMFFYYLSKVNIYMGIYVSRIINTQK